MIKKILLPVFATCVLVACNNTQKEETTNRDIQLLSDSAAFSNNNVYTDSIEEEKAPEELPSTSVGPAERTRPATNPGRQTTKTAVPAPRPAEAIPVKNEVVTEAPAPVATPAAEETVVTKEEKKGWNKATQGAVIGGAAGAVGGAIISKKKGVGAVVGGVAGAAGGYILGKSKDKKDKEKADSINQK